MELNDLTIKEIRKGLIKKEFSAEELSEAYLDKIERKTMKSSLILKFAASRPLIKPRRLTKT